MVGGPSVALLRDIQTLFDAGTVAGLSDRQLLDRFLDARDGSSGAAFEVLVRRHGPMVLRVCRNVLKDWNDAEDAFQATFLILARRCGSIRRRDSVESWLFGVACRVSSRARVEAARRRAIERRGAAEADAALGPAPDDGSELSELGPIVQEEVRRLPEKYRCAVVLCYWEGLTHEQAAARLGCPLGTVRSRIARARELLRRRLTRRGVAPMAGLAASGLDVASIVSIPAVVPDSWVAATVQAASYIAAGGGPAAAGAASAPVAALVQSVLRSMLMTKLKTTAIGLLFIAIGAAGVILAAPQSASTRPRISGPIAREGARKVQPALEPLGDYVVEPPDVLIVEVLEALPGRPISGERLVRPDGKISLGFYGEVYVAGLTLAEVKEKIVRHLRQFLADDTLGLAEIDPDTGKPRGDEKTGKVLLRDLKDTDRVFVDVTAYNSKVYYVQGAVRSPGRFVITGHERVLDALAYAGGMTPMADHDHVMLYRNARGGLDGLPIDVDQITVGDDPSTNYQILPGDRLVIPARTGVNRAENRRGESAAAEAVGASGPDRGRRAEPVPQGSADRPRGVVVSPRGQADEREAIRVLERRLGAVERKLDRIIEALERRGEK